MDAWPPLVSEVLTWAQTDQPQPDQDWDLALINALTLQDFDRLVAKPRVTEGARLFFIGCLYTLVGDAVLTRDTGLLEESEAFWTSGPASQHALTRWRARSLDLIAHPRRYDYAYWGDNPSRFLQEGGL